MADNTNVTSSRDRYMERLKAKYPDREFADEESVYAQINDDYDDYDKRIGAYRDQEKALSDLFVSNPRSAAFLTDWRNGEDPIVSLVRRFGDDFKAALEDPEKQEALAAANKEYAERIAEEDRYEEVYQQNIQETLQMLESLQDEEGLSDEEIDGAMDFLVGISKDALLGRFSREGVLMALKAIHYEADVEEANREGEVRGRNTKIEERLRKSRSGDGMPDLQGSNNAPAGGRSRRKSMFDLAMEAN